jgi:hypothetical protein
VPLLLSLALLGGCWWHGPGRGGRYQDGGDRHSERERHGDRGGDRDGDGDRRER